MITPPALPTNEAAEARIAMIEGSLRAFWLSLVGLVPLFGIPFAIAACVAAFRARRRSRGGELWNPAGRYWVAAMSLAFLTVLLHGLGILLAILSSLD